jgi:predicted RNA methylase
MQLLLCGPSFDCKSMFIMNKKLTFKNLQYIQKSHQAATSNVVWDCAVILSKMIEYQQLTFPMREKSVLEVSAGRGLVAMTCQLLGANVIATELDENLTMLNESCIINGFINHNQIN